MHTGPLQPHRAPSGATPLHHQRHDQCWAPRLPPALYPAFSGTPAATLRPKREQRKQAIASAGFVFSAGNRFTGGLIKNLLSCVAPQDKPHIYIKMRGCRGTSNLSLTPSAAT